MKNLIYDQLKEVGKAEPTYTFGQILFTILRPKYLPGTPSIENIKWLRDISDNDFFTAAEKAIKEINKLKEIQE